MTAACSITSSRSATSSRSDTSPLFLALDQGGSQSRALVLDDRGQVVSSGRCRVATRRLAPDRVEQDPDALVNSLRNAVIQALHPLSPQQRHALQSCGLACQRSSLLAWDNHRRQPLTAVLSWQDCRGRAALPTAPQRLEQLHRRTGLYPSAHHGASKFRWLLDHDRPTQQAAADQRLQLLPLAAYLSHALFGVLAVDPANAQRTLLWDRHLGSWSTELAASFQIDLDWLPPLRASLGDWGRLQLQTLSLPCHLLAGDQSVAPLAEGQLPPGTVQINLGTGGFLCTPLPASAPTASRLLTSVAYSTADHSHYWLEGTVNGAASALHWAQQQGVEPPPQPAPTGLFLNAVGGLGSPYWRSELHSRWLGSDRRDRYRAVWESILFLVQANLNQMQHSGIQLDQIRLSGGLSRIAELPQALANLSGLPVSVSDQPEATARGLGWLLAGQPDHWHPGTPQRFAPQSDSALASRHRRWQRVTQAWLAAPPSTVQRS